VKYKFAKIAGTEAQQRQTERARTKENVTRVDELVLSQQRIECWSKNAFQARMTPSQSLMVTDGALKFNYASVIFIDPGV